jgi:hypothetical protein
MALNSPRFRKVLLQQQTGGTYRTINNTSGTWTNTGAKILRIPQNGITMTPVMPKNEPQWLTGTRSRQPGILGRKSATWSMNQLQMIPSGTAGTAPDTDALWAAAFGISTGTVSAGVSVTYAFPSTDTSTYPFTLLDFPHGSTTLTSRTIWGCIPTEITFNLNGNFFDANVSGTGGYLLDSDNFSSEETVAKAGLTSYPLESSPTSTGSVIAGFGGTVTIGSNSGLETKIQAATIRFQTGYRVVGDIYADGYGVAVVAGLRSVGVSLTFLDDDSSTLQAIKQAAKTNTANDTTITVGTVAGSKVQFVVKQLQLIPQDMRDQSDEVQSMFPESLGHASAVGSVDELSMVFL